MPRTWLSWKWNRTFPLHLFIQSLSLGPSLLVFAMRAPHAFCPGPRGQLVLMRCRCSFHGFTELLTIVRATSSCVRLRRTSPQQFPGSVREASAMRSVCRCEGCCGRMEEGAFERTGQPSDTACVSFVWSNTNLRWSVVIPDNPASAPCFEDRRFAANLRASNEKFTSGSCSKIASGRLHEANARVAVFPILLRAYVVDVSFSGFEKRVLRTVDWQVTTGSSCRRKNRLIVCSTSLCGHSHFGKA